MPERRLQNFTLTVPEDDDPIWTEPSRIRGPAARRRDQRGGRSEAAKPRKEGRRSEAAAGASEEGTLGSLPVPTLGEFNQAIEKLEGRVVDESIAEIKPSTPQQRSTGLNVDRAKDRAEFEAITERNARFLKPFAQFTNVLTSPDFVGGALVLKPLNAASKFANMIGDVRAGRPIDVSDAWQVPDDVIHRTSPTRWVIKGLGMLTGNERLEESAFEVTPADRAAIELSGVIGAETVGFMLGTGVLHQLRRIGRLKPVVEGLKGSRVVRGVARAQAGSAAVRRTLQGGRRVGEALFDTALAAPFVDQDENLFNLAEDLFGWKLPGRTNETDSYLERFGKGLIVEGLAAPMAVIGARGLFDKSFRQGILEGRSNWLDDLAEAEIERYRYRGTDAPIEDESLVVEAPSSAAVAPPQWRSRPRDPVWSAQPPVDPQWRAELTPTPETPTPWAETPGPAVEGVDPWRAELTPTPEPPIQWAETPGGLGAGDPAWRAPISTEGVPRSLEPDPWSPYAGPGRSLAGGLGTPETAGSISEVDPWSGAVPSSVRDPVLGFPALPTTGEGIGRGASDLDIIQAWRAAPPGPPPGPERWWHALPRWSELTKGLAQRRREFSREGLAQGRRDLDVLASDTFRPQAGPLPTEVRRVIKDPWADQRAPGLAPTEPPPAAPPPTPLLSGAEDLRLAGAPEPLALPAGAELPPDPWVTPLLPGAQTPRQLALAGEATPQFPALPGTAEVLSSPYPPALIQQWAEAGLERYGSAIERWLDESDRLLAVEGQRQRLQDMGLLVRGSNQRLELQVPDADPALRAALEGEVFEENVDFGALGSREAPVFDTEVQFKPELDTLLAQLDELSDSELLNLDARVSGRQADEALAEAQDQVYNLEREVEAIQERLDSEDLGILEIGAARLQLGGVQRELAAAQARVTEVEARNALPQAPIPEQIRTAFEASEGLEEITSSPLLSGPFIQDPSFSPADYTEALGRLSKAQFRDILTPFNIPGLKAAFRWRDALVDPMTPEEASRIARMTAEDLAANPYQAFDTLTLLRNEVIKRWSAEGATPITPEEAMTLVVGMARHVTDVLALMKARTGRSISDASKRDYIRALAEYSQRRGYTLRLDTPAPQAPLTDAGAGRALRAEQREQVIAQRVDRREWLKAQILQRAIENGEVQAPVTPIPKRPNEPKIFGADDLIADLWDGADDTAAYQGRNAAALEDELRLRYEYNLLDAATLRAQKGAQLALLDWERLDWDRKKRTGFLDRGMFALRREDITQENASRLLNRPEPGAYRFRRGELSSAIERRRFDPTPDAVRTDLVPSRGPRDLASGAYRNRGETRAGATPSFTPTTPSPPEGGRSAQPYRNLGVTRTPWGAPVRPQWPGDGSYRGEGVGRREAMAFIDGKSVAVDPEEIAPPPPPPAPPAPPPAPKGKRRRGRKAQQQASAPPPAPPPTPARSPAAQARAEAERVRSELDREVAAERAADIATRRSELTDALGREQAESSIKPPDPWQDEPIREIEDELRELDIEAIEATAVRDLSEMPPAGRPVTELIMDDGRAVEVSSEWWVKQAESDLLEKGRKEVQDLVEAGFQDRVGPHGSTGRMVNYRPYAVDYSRLPPDEANILALLEVMGLRRANTPKGIELKKPFSEEIARQALLRMAHNTGADVVAIANALGQKFAGIDGLPNAVVQAAAARREAVSQYADVLEEAALALEQGALTPELRKRVGHVTQWAYFFEQLDATVRRRVGQALRGVRFNTKDLDFLGDLC